jgi:hypothetical protein
MPPNVGVGDSIAAGPVDLGDKGGGEQRRERKDLPTQPVQLLSFVSWQPFLYVH